MLVGRSRGARRRCWPRARCGGVGACRCGGSTSRSRPISRVARCAPGAVASRAGRVPLSGGRGSQGLTWGHAAALLRFKGMAVTLPAQPRATAHASREAQERPSTLPVAAVVAVRFGVYSRAGGVGFGARAGRGGRRDCRRGTPALVRWAPVAAPPGLGVRVVGGGVGVGFGGWRSCRPCPALGLRCC